MCAAAGAAGAQERVQHQEPSQCQGNKDGHAGARGDACMHRYLKVHNSTPYQSKEHAPHTAVVRCYFCTTLHTWCHPCHAVSNSSDTRC